MLDIFNSDLFGVVPLTDAINTPVFAPGRIGQLGIFQEQSVASTTIVIEEQAGQLALIAPTPRGGPGVTLGKVGRKGRALKVPHFEINDAVMAEEVQGVRAWGTEDQVQFVQDLVSGRLLLHRASHEVTIEYSRIGAIKGLITYADATTLDLFDEFDVTQEGEQDMALDVDGTATSALRVKCQGIIRLVGENLGGMPFTGIRALCGNTFFDNLMANKEVIQTYLQTPNAGALRQSWVTPNGLIWSSVELFGISWENYRGGVGATKFVDDDLCHFYPEGVPGLFKTYLAPADYNETVNRPGQRMYVKQYDMPNDKGVNLDSQTNNLNICTRPKCLIQGKRT